MVTGWHEVYYIDYVSIGVGQQKKIYDIMNDFQRKLIFSPGLCVSVVKEKYR